MAVFHFTAKIHGRGKGASAVRAAAYRAGERLFDQRAGKHEDYRAKRGVIETALLMPEGAPDWSREQLWQAVETRERRRDAQLAQELEIGLPREFSDAENWRLVTDFVREQLVAYGRVCDVAFHKTPASDGGDQPHAHVLMPLRVLEGGAFGAKHPHVSWETFLDRRDHLGELREAWCAHTQRRAAELGIDLGPGFDHRSLNDRGLDLEGQPKHGATAQRLEREGTPAERTAEKLAADRRNGERLIANPGLALDALTQRQSTFTDADLARWIFKHSAEDQFAQILAKARPLAVAIGTDDRGQARYSTAEMIALEAKMVRDAAAMASRQTHRVAGRPDGGRLSEAQQRAAAYLLEQGDLACLIGYAGAGKSTLLNEARAVWEAQGYRVRGAALSGIAAESLAGGSGIAEARTIASYEYAWERARDQLTGRDILVVDEAGMIGSRGLARLITQAQDAGAKIVLVGDPQQLQAIEAGGAFRAIAERVGTAELTEVRRQHAQWQRDATLDLATGRTAAALARYRIAGCIETRPTDADAKLHLVERWAADRLARPDGSQIMMTHTNDDVRQLNAIARDLMRAEGQLGLEEVELDTSFGRRGFAAGDRLMFRRNDRALNVKNGTLGTVTKIAPDRLAVHTDDGRTVEVDPQAYRDLAYGYAATVHKAQGVTVDRAYVLATSGFDRHTAYVACSRHRDDLVIVHSEEAFASDAALASLLRRNRQKDVTLDYREATLRAPMLDHPAPKPMRDFMDAHLPQPARPAPQRDGIADAWTAWGEENEMPERSWERQRGYNRGLEP